MKEAKEPTLGNGKICYVQIPATDVTVSSSFYHAVFGWEIRKRSDGHLAFDDGVGQVSGAWVTGRKPYGEAPGILVYIMVNDIDAVMQNISTYGGKIVQQVGMDAPEITARFSDPDGNIFGLFQQ